MTSHVSWRPPPCEHTTGTGLMMPYLMSSSNCALTSSSQCLGMDAGVWMPCGSPFITGSSFLVELNVVAEKCCNNQSSSRRVCSSSGGKGIPVGHASNLPGLEAALSAVNTAANEVWWRKSTCNNLNSLHEPSDRKSTLAEDTKYTTCSVKNLQKVMWHAREPRHFRVRFTKSRRPSLFCSCTGLIFSLFSRSFSVTHL